MVQATDAASVATSTNRLFTRHDKNRDAKLSFAEIFGSRQGANGQVKSSAKAASASTPEVPVTRASSVDLQAALISLQASSQASTPVSTESAVAPPGSLPAAAAPIVANSSSPVSAATAGPDAKPDTAHFMAATGTDFKTASSLLYGVIGSNQDLRDWKAIMSSPDPVAAARAATGAMYNSSQSYLSPDATRPQDRPDTTVLAQSGNFVYYKEKIPDLNIDNYVFALVDSNGYQLTSAANSSRVAPLAKNFGFDTSAIASMEQQLDAKGISFRGGAWPNGFLG